MPYGISGHAACSSDATGLCATDSDAVGLRAKNSPRLLASLVGRIQILRVPRSTSDQLIGHHNYKNRKATDPKANILTH